MLIPCQFGYQGYIYIYRLFRNCAGSVWALVPDQDQRGGEAIGWL